MPGYEWPKEVQYQVIGHIIQLRRIYSYSEVGMRREPEAKEIVNKMKQLGVRATQNSETPVDKPPAP